MKFIDKLLRRESRPSATSCRNYATDTEELPPPSLAGESTRSAANSEGRLISEQHYEVPVHNAEAVDSTFVAPVTINSKRDKGPSFRLRRLGLPPTPHVEIKVDLVPPFEGIISGNSTARGDVVFCSAGWPADYPIPKEVVWRKKEFLSPRAREEQITP
jgi:hypothetical protein